MSGSVAMLGKYVNLIVEKSENSKNIFGNMPWKFEIIYQTVLSW